MSDSDNSYYRLLFAIRERNKYDSVYESALDELSGKVDFSWVKSCVSMGTGHGTHEISFARRFLPNLKTFVAVEEDHESVKAFKANAQDGKLPGVEVTAQETSVQCWKGVDKPVDLVLLLDILQHVKRADRQALFQQLFTHQLAENGVIIIIADIYGPAAGLMLILERIGKPFEVSYDEAEKEMLAAGFTLVYTQDIRAPVDFSNPSDDLVQYFQLITHNAVSDEEVRAAINDVAGPNSQMDLSKKMGIFKKLTH